jgi:hypothetical protein
MVQAMSIATKLHIVAGSKSNIDGKTLGSSRPLVQEMLKAPCFVLDRDTIPILQSDACEQSLKALILAELARLPYPKIVVEFEASANFRDFVLLEEHDGKLRASVVFLDKETMRSIVINQPVTVEFFKDKDDIGPGILIHTKIDHADLRQTAITATLIATCAAMVLLNTRGIVKEVIETTRLNKARAKHGKVAIPSHSIIHVLTVYRKDGTKIKRVAGQKMPMHMRAGHVRNQRHGEGYAETKLIYIEPTIVNYDPSGELKHIERVVRK